VLYQGLVPEKAKKEGADEDDDCIQYHELHTVFGLLCGGNIKDHL